MWCTLYCNIHLVIRYATLASDHMRNNSEYYKSMCTSQHIPTVLYFVSSFLFPYSMQTPGDKQLPGVHPPILVGNPGHLPTSTQSSSVPTSTGSGFTDAKGSTATEPRASLVCEYGGKKEECGKFVDGDCDDYKTPVLLHTTSDLAEVLVEYNKLQGRLLQFTSNHSPLDTMYVTCTLSTRSVCTNILWCDHSNMLLHKDVHTLTFHIHSIPNIRDHNLKDVRVVGCEDHQQIEVGIIICLAE